MVSSIEVQSDLRTSDLYWLVFSNAVRTLFYARWILAIVLIILVALGARYIALVAVLLKPPILYFLIGGLIYVAVALPYLRSRALAQTTMGTSNKLFCEVGPQGVDVRRQGSQAHYDWASVRRAKQTSNLILLYFDGHSTLVIPKRCFATPEQLDEFRSIVSTYATAREGKRNRVPD